MIDEMMPAPALTLTATDGHTTALDAPGGWLVVFFYPKDDTPGCTREALGFSARLGDFAAAGARVVGVSRDSAARHDKFIAKHGLSVPLVSDADGAVSEAFGTWGEKTLYGRRYMGMERATFLIDPEGRVRRAWRKVKVDGHAEDVLASLRALQS